MGGVVPAPSITVMVDVYANGVYEDSALARKVRTEVVEGVNEGMRELRIDLRGR
jgi:hypothetical protein